MTNTTTGVNTVLKNLLLEPEDILLLNSHTYGACSKVISLCLIACRTERLLQSKVRISSEVIKQLEKNTQS